VYTLAVLCILVTVHRQRQDYGNSSSLPSSSSDEAYLVAFEKDLLRAAKAKEVQHKQQQQQQQQQQQREQEKQNRRAEAKKGEEGGTEETKEERGKIEGPNFSGVWKSIPGKNSNYDEFLTVQGVPYLKRKIANSTVVTHTIQQDGDILKLEVCMQTPSFPSSLLPSFPASLLSASSLSKRKRA